MIREVKEDPSGLSISRVLILVFSRIGDLLSGDLAPGRKRVQPGAGSACDFPHFNSAGQQRVRYQGAMTTPGNGFSTHNCDPFRLRKFYQIVQVVPELGRLHVIGEAPEAGVMPADVERIPARMPEAAQSGKIGVMKAGGM